MRRYGAFIAAVCLAAPALAAGIDHPRPELEECCGYHVDFTIQLGKEGYTDGLSGLDKFGAQALCNVLPSLNGELCYDGITGVGEECVTPETGLSQFVVWAGPLTQTAEDIDDYPSKPKVYLEDGQVVGIDGAITWDASFDVPIIGDISFTAILEIVGDDLLASVSSQY